MKPVFGGFETVLKFIKFGYRLLALNSNNLEEIVVLKSKVQDASRTELNWRGHYYLPPV